MSTRLLSQQNFYLFAFPANILLITLNLYVHFNFSSGISTRCARLDRKHECDSYLVVSSQPQYATKRC